MDEFKAWVLKAFGNQAHPERRSNEVYIGNFSLADMNSVGFKSKRIGVTARDRELRPLKFSGYEDGTFPVFVSVDEMYTHYTTVVVKQAAK
jgi:hypothetical protein